jgi:hypothetical protein
VRRGVRQVLQQAIEVELAQLLEQYANVKTLSGRQAIRGADQIQPLLDGVPFKDGIPVQDNPPEQQKLAA